MRSDFDRIRAVAFEAACRVYGVKSASAGNLATYPLKQKATDPAMERQRWRSGIDMALNAHETFDRSTGNVDPSPQPGMINRSEG